jgi:hypothetical protein
MKKSKRSIGDLIEIYGLLLAYVRFDSDYHDCDTADCGADSCPDKLSERGQKLYDDRKLWHLIKAVPELLEACQALLSVEPCDDVDDIIFQKIIPATNKAA